MKKFIAYAVLPFVLVMMIFFSGCGAGDDEDLTDIKADFTYSMDAATGNATFTNTSTNARTYLWSFGDGGSSTEVNPIHQFAPGTYQTTLTAANNSGGLDQFIGSVYYGGIATNGNFETGTTDGWTLFQNGGTAALDNTINNGGTWSGRLATRGISNPSFKQERIAADVVKAGDLVQITFDYKGSIVNDGGIFNVLLFGEGANGASFTHIFSPAPVPGTNWASFSGTYRIANGTDVTEGISFLIEAVCGGVPGCGVTVNIDNVTVALNP